MIRELTMNDYDGIIQLFISTPADTFRQVDSREATERYLNRNLPLSFIAIETKQMVMSQD